MYAMRGRRPRRGGEPPNQCRLSPTGGLVDAGRDSRAANGARTDAGGAGKLAGCGGLHSLTLGDRRADPTALAGSLSALLFQAAGVAAEFGVGRQWHWIQAWVGASRMIGRLR